MLRKSHDAIERGPGPAIRTRRVYFDTRFGQLHVRTAFPGTGGFDEQPPLLCIHEPGASSRDFGDFLAAIAVRRSVYAPDLPGSGESDPAPPGAAPHAAAIAIHDLAADLRLRRLDLFAVGPGAAIARAFAAEAADWVRRAAILGTEDLPCWRDARHPTLVLATDPQASAATRGPAPAHPLIEIVDASEYRDRPFVLAPAALAERVARFLDRP